MYITKWNYLKNEPKPTLHGFAIPNMVTEAYLRQGFGSAFLSVEEADILREMMIAEQHNIKCTTEYLMKKIPFNEDAKIEYPREIYENVDFENMSAEEFEKFEEEHPKYEEFTKEIMQQYIDSLIERGYVFKEQ